MERYPLELTTFKTDYYQPKPHYRNKQSWDHFTMHIPLWIKVLTHYFDNKSNLKFLELGSGNGLCANYLLDNYNCTLDTVDMTDIRVENVDGVDYEISTTKNLKPFIDGGRCVFNPKSTKDFLHEMIAVNLNEDEKYDFIYVDASHEPDDVLYDSVLSFELLKKEGLMIFDDYGWGECGKGIDSFLSAYEKKYTEVFKGYQVGIHKL
tara:strand:- start:27 stop:647 length:621 start_codon:yes stop_codon:yes gene_type:complete